MTIDPLLPQTSRTRRLLDQAVATREEYNDYLRGVANGERDANPEVKELLQERCQLALQAWREAHAAWAAAGAGRPGESLSR